MGNYDAEVRVSTKVDTSQMQRLELQIEKAAQKVETLTKKLEEVKNQRTPTEAYGELESKLNSAKASLEALIAEEEKFTSIGATVGGAWDNLIQKEADAQLKVEAIQEQMQKLVDEGKAFTLNHEDINKAANELSRAKSELRMLVTKQDELGAKAIKVSEGFRKIGTVAKKSFSGVNQNVRKSNNLLGSFATRLKSMALSLLIFNWISKGFRDMCNGIKEGFKNLVQYSSEYNRSISSLQSANAQLKNSFAAAFAPIVQMIIPYLVQLIGYVTTAMNTIAQFIAILSGASTWTKATAIQKNYAASLKGTASAAKKAAGALASFDEIEVLSKKDNSGSAAGGADPSQMFEKVPVDPKFKEWLDSILNKLKPLLEYLKELGGIFMDGFWDGLGDYEYRIEGIEAGFEKIKDALRDIFTDPEVVASAKQYVESLVHLFGTVVGAIASIGLTIAMAFMQGLGDYLQNNKDRIKDYLINMFDIGTEINTLFADLFVSIAYIFEAFASEAGIKFVESLIGVIVDAFMGTSEIFLKLGRDILEIIVTPITENADEFKTALEGLLSVGAEVLDGFKETIDSVYDNLNSVYDEHFKPFFDSVADGLTTLVGKFLDIWNSDIQPILDKIGAKTSELLTQYLGPFVNSAIDLLGNLFTMLQVLWENIVQPIINLLITYVFPVLGEIFGEYVTAVLNGGEKILSALKGGADFVNSFAETWIDVWNSAEETFDAFWKAVEDTADLLKDALSGLIDFVKLLISGDWKGAWDSAKETFGVLSVDAESTTDSIKNFFSEAFEFIKNLASEAVDRIIETWEKLRGAFLDSPLGEALSQIADTIASIWNEHIQPIVDEIVEKLSNFYSQHLEPFIEQVKRLFENLFGTLKRFWDDIGAPLVEVITDYIIPLVVSVIKTAIETIVGIVMGLVELIKEGLTLLAEFLLERLQILIDFITSCVQFLFELGAQLCNFLLEMVGMWIDGFTQFMDFLNTLLEIWNSIWDSAKEVFKTFWTAIENIIVLLKELFTGLVSFVKLLIAGDWKNAWATAKNIFSTFKTNVKNVVDSIKELLQSFFDWVSELIEGVIGKLQEIGSTVTGLFSGGGIGKIFGSGGSSSSSSGGGAAASFQSYSSYAAEIPHLATGAVIRGGNPFMAVLGDQKFGQTNIEAPLSTIEDAVRNVMSESAYSGSSSDVTVNLNYDGETFARLFLPDFLSEAHRQGYDIEFEPT